MNVTSSMVDAAKRRAKISSKQNGTAYLHELNSIVRSEGHLSFEQYQRQFIKTERKSSSSPLFKCVQIRFSGTESAWKPGTVVLRVLSDNELVNGPFNALLCYVPSDDQPRAKVVIVANVRIDVLDSAAVSRAQAVEMLRAAAVTTESLVLPEDFPLVLQFTRADDYSRVVFSIGPWVADQIFRVTCDVSYARTTGFRPAWYNEDQHSALFAFKAGLQLVEWKSEYFEWLDDVGWLFGSAGFKRGREANRLEYSLMRVARGKDGAGAFQRWVSDVFRCLFADSLDRVKMNPNGKARSRRDIGATNTRASRFWNRLFEDYNVREVVIETKNYAEPSAKDFVQVCNYLKDRHYGDLGFLVTNGPTAEISRHSWDHIRDHYKAQKKIVLIVPSLMLKRLLNECWTHRSERIDGEMESWLTTAIRKQLAW